MSHFTHKDAANVYEAYLSVDRRQLISEDMMPTEPGEGFGSPIDFKKIPDTATKYLKQVPEGEHRQQAVWIIAKKVKDFLQTCEKSTFTGTYQEFRNKIAEIIQQSLPAIGKANAGYSARVIQEFLVDAGIIKDERNGKQKISKAAKVVDTDALAKTFAELMAQEEASKPAPSAASNAPTSPASSKKSAQKKA